MGTMFICVCILAFLQISSVFSDSIIVSSLRDGQTNLTILEVDVTDGSLSTIQSESFLKSQILTNIAVDPISGTLFGYDFRYGNILQYPGFGKSGASVTGSVVHKGITRNTLVKVAVDWVSQNIYWVDPGFRWIGIQSVSDQTKHTIILHDGFTYPVSLAVDPIHRVLFWGDGSSSPKIERSSLDGGNRRTIVSQGIIFPTAMTVDVDNEQLIWLDLTRDTVEMAALDGTARLVLRRLSHIGLFHVDVFKDFVFLTKRDIDAYDVYVMDKLSGDIDHMLHLEKKDRINGVVSLKDTQQTIINNCATALCSDLCVNTETRFKCLCVDGRTLSSDLLTCVDGPGSLHRALVWTNSTSLCATDLRVINDASFRTSDTCIHTDSDIIHFDVNARDRTIVYARGSAIYITRLDAITTNRQLLVAANDVTGLGVDWRDGNLYWSEGQTDGRIIVHSPQEKATVPLIDSGLSMPRELTLFPLKGKMFWISGGVGIVQIERANMDGTNRVIIVNSSYVRAPLGLAVDTLTDILYFVDEGFVKSVWLNGTVMEVEDLEGLSSPQRLYVYQNQLLVISGTSSRAKLQVFSSRMRDLTFTEDISFPNILGAKVLDERTQPDIFGPCEENIGGCEHICIPLGNVRVCQCQFGFQLHQDKKSCFSETFSANFVYVSDWTHDRIYQVSLDNDKVAALDAPMVTKPVGIEYNFKTGHLIWSSTETNLIQSTNTDGTDYGILVNVGVFGSFADRLAVDYTSGNVYFTAVPFVEDGFVGVGVVSPTGVHTKLVSYGHSPRAIALDPAKGIMFWTDHGFTDGTSSEVLAANMDGSQRRVINSNMGWADGLTIDTAGKFLYIADGKTDTISKCNYNGICSAFFSDTGALLMDIKLLENNLYYTAWNRVHITRIDILNTDDREELARNAELGRLDSLALHDAEYTVSSQCTPNDGLGPCRYLCLPRPDGYTCACEDGQEESIVTCSGIFTKPSETKEPTLPPLTSQPPVTDSSVGVLVGAVVGTLAGLAVLVVLGVVACYFYRRRQSKKATDSGHANPAFDIASFSTSNQDIGQDQISFSVSTKHHTPAFNDYEGLTTNTPPRIYDRPPIELPLSPNPQQPVSGILSPPSENYDYPIFNTPPVNVLHNRPPVELPLSPNPHQPASGNLMPPSENIDQPKANTYMSLRGDSIVMGSDFDIQ